MCEVGRALAYEGEMVGGGVCKREDEVTVPMLWVRGE